MFIHTHNQLIKLPRSLSLRAMECQKVTWAYRGVVVPVPEITQSPESHCLVSFERGECPHALAFGTQAQIEDVFAALVAAIARDERIFNLDKAMDTTL